MRWIVDLTGSALAPGVAVVVVIVRLAVGVVGGFTEQWLSVLVAVTSAVTLLMVFLIQHTPPAATHERCA